MRVHRQLACAARGVPGAPQLRAWVAGALRHAGAGAGELTVRVVDDGEMAMLNRAYRGKAGTTNVLSFTADDPLGAEPPYLGDIVISAPAVVREAAEQGKTTRAHWAHLVVHATLHLLGHDHTRSAAARRMEGLEREILREFGYADPYAAGQ